MKKKLDPFSLALYGKKIIEASAGTGKTFTLIIIYLRLLLGINHKKYAKRVFSVQEILVVTFTQATREELYQRIKKNIRNLRIACVKKHSENPTFKKLLSYITDFNNAIILLLKAENDIDQAAIHTIHGFCYDSLKEYTLYSDIPIKHTIVENIESLYLQATYDFWNKQFYLFNNDIGEIISKYWNSPESFLKDILPLLTLSSNLIIVNSRQEKNILQYHKYLINIINIFKKKWLKIKNILLPLIKKTNINKHIYHDKNLLKWIEIITYWAKTPTKNYFIPHTLHYFKHTILNKNKNTCILNNIFFKEVDIFLKINFSLKDIFLSQAIKNIPIIINKEKKNTSCIEFNDLLIFFYRAIKKNFLFAQLISKKYPIALIDEFQDTDLYQYKIFNTIYTNNNINLLILIGDSKQSIYGFRGANIFSYLHAKSKIEEQYYLDTNWRSSYNMTNSINFIFSRLKKPFLLPSIDFLPIQSPVQNKNMIFEIDGETQPALRFLIKPGNNIYIDEYHTWISQECAKYISYWLYKGEKGNAIIKKNNHTYPLRPCDIVIIVRNKKEANIIKKELDNFNIKSCYLSENNNIYHTREAYEILSILKSILYPKDENLLRQAMFTNILSYNSQEIDNLHNNLEYWSSIIIKLKKYAEIWESSGILTMIKTIVTEYNKFQNNQFNMNNVLQLSELLQSKSREINNFHLLIFWFENKINDTTNNPKKNKNKKFINKNYVKIITTYKSKGLEYNIVWFPFAVSFFNSKFNLYHNKKNKKTILDFNITKKKLNQSKNEHFSEEIRLLYVTLTRSILHCSIGIAPIVKKKYQKKDNFTDLHNSSLGYIIQLGKICNSKTLKIELEKIRKKNSIEIEYNSIQSKIIQKINTIKINTSHHMTFTRNIIQDNWQIISYSVLKNLQKKQYKNKIANDIFFKKNIKKINNILYTPHTFPKGSVYGILLHEILKEYDFHQIINPIWLNEKIKKYQLNKKWLNALEQWIINITHAPLLNQKLTLSKLDPKKQIKELEFYIPIERKIKDHEINKVIKNYDNISNVSPDLSFKTVKGMLTGSIDLVFFWENKYYIVDYKSTWLGNSAQFYTQQTLKDQIIKNRYDLQYQFYCVALNRYLKQRIKKYQFSLHFGGIFYLFLRSMDGSNSNNGVFYTMPHYELVEKLDMMFSIIGI